MTGKRCAPSTPAGKPRLLRMVTHDPLPRECTCPHRYQHPPLHGRASTPRQLSQPRPMAAPLIPPMTAPSLPAAPLPPAPAPPTTVPALPRSHPPLEGRQIETHDNKRNSKRRNRPQPSGSRGSPSFCSRCRQRGHKVNHCTTATCDFVAEVGTSLTTAANDKQRQRRGSNVLTANDAAT